ncbi:hypothetical protein [Flagellimonas algicola]|uniref:Uncharacterized protein n=1 Tax=Flagellimonas algicola TaxID=2583815 RepID=A0ABY2WRJ3_9FLAO|nr:hypothetical protein [Allomuricauda algicola]TMU57598.1 hypothetical protein FGG15_08640 [Allomuricauda algicola]
MESSKTKLSKRILKRARRIAYIFLSAYMLGLSNVVLEEERLINDSRAKVEQQEIQEEDDDL